MFSVSSKQHHLIKKYIMFKTKPEVHCSPQSKRKDIKHLTLSFKNLKSLVNINKAYVFFITVSKN